MPKGSPGIKRRPKTQEEKDHQRAMILKRWQDPEYQQRVSDGLRNNWKKPDKRSAQRKRMSDLAQNPTWRKKVSEGTSKAFANPEIRIRHQAAIDKSIAENGANYWGGNTGKAFASVLCPVGFIREHRVYYGEPVVQVFGRNRFRQKNFSLDFAHIEGKINIELDGPGHKVHPEGDNVRDAILKELGWRIIRIRHD